MPELASNLVADSVVDSVKRAHKFASSITAALNSPTSDELIRRERISSQQIQQHIEELETKLREYSRNDQ